MGFMGTARNPARTRGSLAGYHSVLLEESYLVIVLLKALLWPQAAGEAPGEAHLRGIPTYRPLVDRGSWGFSGGLTGWNLGWA